eukprot:10791600-Lingulodinium_polyedra.AAC.1
MRGALRAWLAGHQLPRHVFPNLHGLELGYQQLTPGTPGNLRSMNNVVPSDVSSEQDAGWTRS